MARVCQCAEDTGVAACTYGKWVMRGRLQRLPANRSGRWGDLGWVLMEGDR
jgi:hypothetical protein